MVGDGTRYTVACRVAGPCNEQLPADLYPEGCSAQVQVCGRLEGHDGDHRAWVSMAPTVVDWPEDVTAASERAASRAYADSLRDDPTITEREAALRAQVAAGGLDPANEITPAMVEARIADLCARAARPVFPEGDTEPGDAK